MVHEILEKLKQAIPGFDNDGAVKCAKEIVEKGIDPTEALDAMTAVMKSIGDSFEKGELFLPDLVGAANTMEGATKILEEEINRRGVKSETAGTVVAGTVFGDIHNIGKNMVCTFLKANGFTVYDLGINVTASQFVDAVKKYNANVLVMSALLTTTVHEMKMVIDTLKQEGIRSRISIMVGGGAITQQFADNIGADGYDPTAPGAAQLARRLISG
jgi:corrinoid protein of di/trimethylamine methyltransferase